MKTSFILLTVLAALGTAIPSSLEAAPPSKGKGKGNPGYSSSGKAGKSPGGNSGSYQPSGGNPTSYRGPSITYRSPTVTYRSPAVSYRPAVVTPIVTRPVYRPAPVVVRAAPRPLVRPVVVRRRAPAVVCWR